MGNFNHLTCIVSVQVTVQYRQDRGAVVPLRVHTIVISVQHDEGVGVEEMRRCLKEQVVKAVVPAGYLDDDTIYHLQPSGRFVIGGPQVSEGARVDVCFCVLKHSDYFHCCKQSTHSSVLRV